jgi:hypothetical protein
VRPSQPGSKSPHTQHLTLTFHSTDCLQHNTSIWIVIQISTQHQRLLPSTPVSKPLCLTRSTSTRLFQALAPLQNALSISTMLRIAAILPRIPEIRSLVRIASTSSSSGCDAYVSYLSAVLGTGNARGGRWTWVLLGRNVSGVVSHYQLKSGKGCDQKPNITHFTSFPVLKRSFRLPT